MIGPRVRNSSSPNSSSTPFRFYDNRQKYLAFITASNEKSAIARRAADELARLQPSPPALRLFDAGMGDGTVITRLMRSAHRQFPTVPMSVVAKEISLEDVRLGLEKLPDRLFEHPATVFVVTNLNYTEAPHLELRDEAQASALNWQEVRLSGTTADQYAQQIEDLGALLANGWQTTPSPRTGNPLVVRPSVLVLYREDHEFLLDAVIPKLRQSVGRFDLVLASQPWRARMDADFKVRKVLSPLARSLAPGGRLLAIQSYGHDPALEIVRQLWPDEQPFRVGRHELLETLRRELGGEARHYDLSDPPDDEAIFRYQMHTLPSEICDRIGTSTLFAAWNAAIYVNQIEDERLDAAVTTGAYLEATQRVLQKYGGLWFNDEAFVVARRHSGP